MQIIAKLSLKMFNVVKEIIHREVAFVQKLKNFKRLVFKIKIRVIIRIICIVVIFKSILSKF